MDKLYGAVEAGGTKFVCGVGRDDQLISKTSFPTSTPQETLAKACNFFQSFPTLAAIGIGCFGPVALHPSSPDYGTITQTPKPGWSNTDIVGQIKKSFSLPVAFDTDVNASAIGERLWGVAKGCDNLVYITVGTGIGGGVICSGRTIHGLVHPELGHIAINKHPNDDYQGHCPFHADRCLEGLCSGPAIANRWQQKGEALDDNHPAWELQSHYLGQALATVICTLSPEKIILGGGVMQRDSLFRKIHQKTQQALNGYVQHAAILENIEQYIVAPGLGSDSALLGALYMAEHEARK